MPGERAKIGLFIDVAAGDQDPVGADTEDRGACSRCVDEVEGQKRADTLEFRKIVRCLGRARRIICPED